VLDRRGVRYEHRSDQALKFGDLLGSAKVFLSGDWFAPFFFLLPTLEFALLVFSQRLLSEREHFHDCPV